LGISFAIREEGIRQPSSVGPLL